MSLEDKLDRYSYLWDGSENWILQLILVENCSLTIHFEEGLTVKDVFALRKVFPYFHNRKPHKIKEELANQSEWKPKNLDNNDVVFKYYDKALAEGLNAMLWEYETSAYLIVNSETNDLLILEDQALQAKIIEKMLEAGVHVEDYT